jgi:hypothetical protein
VGRAPSCGESGSVCVQAAPTTIVNSAAVWVKTEAHLYLQRVVILGPLRRVGGHVRRAVDGVLARVQMRGGRSRRCYRRWARNSAEVGADAGADVCSARQSLQSRRRAAGTWAEIREAICGSRWAWTDAGPPAGDESNLHFATREKNVGKGICCEVCVHDKERRKPECGRW